MNLLSRLSIRQRLSVGFGVILVLMSALTIIGTRNVSFIDQTLTEITDINSVKQRYAINFRGSVHDRAIAIRDVALGRTNNEIVEFEREIDRLAQFYTESENKMRSMLSSGVTFSAQERSILADIDAIKRQTTPIISDIIARKKRGEQVDILVLEQARPAFVAWLASINKFIDYQESVNQIATPKAREVAGGFSMLMYFSTLIALLLSVVVGLLIERSLRRSLGGEPFEAEIALTNIAQGDLTQKVNTDYSNSMLGSVDKMQSKLSSIVKNISQASQELASQTSVVSAGSDDIYSSAKSQASLTQNTAASLEQLRSSIAEVSNIAAHTEENSAHTVESANQGRDSIVISAQQMDHIAEAVDKTMSQVKKLAENTKKITGFTNVINGISEQTNLLALNAAIEAARAGSSGRGFAVVADEVRNLAQSTSDATAEIDQMISEIHIETEQLVLAMERAQPQVEFGRTKVFEAQEILHNISQQASDSLVRVQQVASATAEQAVSIEEVTQTMDEIATMSANTIVAMENNSKAANSLNQLSDSLKSDVDYFRVN